MSDAPAQPPLAGATEAPPPEWHGLTLFTPAPSKNVWLAYPVYLEKFAGASLADEPIENHLKNGVGFLAGLRTGWDYASHWSVGTFSADRALRAPAWERRRSMPTPQVKGAV